MLATALGGAADPGMRSLEEALLLRCLTGAGTDTGVVTQKMSEIRTAVRCGCWDRLLALPHALGNSLDPH